MKMPLAYVLEMFCDRVAASKVYNKEKYTQRDPLAYYKRGEGKQLMHAETAALLEKLLVMLAEEGEEKTFSYIRTELLGKKK